MNAIQLLEALGKAPVRTAADRHASIAASDLDESCQAALHAGDAGRLAALLGGRVDIQGMQFVDAMKSLQFVDAVP